MKKFDLVTNPAAMPDRILALPELNYPDRLNATETLFRNAADNSWHDRTAYYCNGKSWTYRQLIDEVERLAAAFSSLGVGPDDRVILRMIDSPRLVAAILALQGIGAIAVPTYTQLRADDIAYRIADCQCKLLITEARLQDEVSKALDVAAQVETVVVVAGDDSSGRFVTLDAILKHVRPFNGWADTHADDVCLILYTSGTTGRPKAAAHCHRDLMVAGDTFSRYILRTQPKDMLAGPPPLPFAMGLAFLVYYPLRFGASAVLCPEKTIDAFVQAFRDHAPTIFISVPTFYHRLLEVHRSGTDVPLGSFRKLLCAGEPLYQEFERTWADETGVPLEQIIGTTELLHAVIGFRTNMDANRFATLGRACPGYEVSVRDPETFETVPSGEPGLFCVRGPTAPVYWSPRGVQDSAVRDGWNVIQDLIRMDDDGYIQFVARADEMIVSGGMNISPVDVERVLLQHPAVSECACVPSPDDKGERAMVPKVYIVASPGQITGDTLVAALQSFFKDNAPPFMYPRKIEFIDALPKSLTGKIQRSVLKEREIGG